MAGRLSHLLAGFLAALTTSHSFAREPEPAAPSKIENIPTDKPGSADVLKTIAAPAPAATPKITPKLAPKITPKIAAPSGVKTPPLRFTGTGATLTGATLATTTIRTKPIQFTGTGAPLVTRVDVGSTAVTTPPLRFTGTGSFEP